MVMVQLSGLVIFMSFLSLCLQNKHFLSILLLLEMIALSLFTCFSFVVGSESEMYIILVFLAVMTCDAACGLSLLVSSARKMGDDYIYSLTLSKF